MTGFEPRECRVYGIDQIISHGMAVVDNGDIIWVSPMSACYTAGLRDGDRIVQVNGNSVVGKTRAEILRLMRINRRKLILLIA
jgi:C-terminal processing protease CtpA/Prc